MEGPTSPIAVPDTAGAAPLRIVVHHVAGRKPAAEALLQPVVRDGGDVEFRSVRSSLAVTAVRYFLPEDQAAAEHLAARLGPGWQVQDFTFYRPRPSRGTLEVWLPRLAS